MKFNKYIDHTNLNIRAKENDIIKLCEEAKKHSFAAVCVSPNHVSLVSSQLKETNIGICTVIGFPNGYVNFETKVFEMKHLMLEGATELDVVLNLQDVADKKWKKIEEELKKIRLIGSNRVIKLIIESSELTDAEIRMISEICCHENINFVKTSTGFNGRASLEAVRIIKETVGDRALIKASGGIKTKEQASQYIEAGASRLGTSAGILLVT